MRLKLTTLVALLYPFLVQVKAINQRFPYGSQKIRGVNLGGWLLLEPWITPSVFQATGNDAIVDEFTFGQLQDRGTAEAALRRHWDSFITEGDFGAIRGAGLNHVRIPIGYWAFQPDAPFITGALPYLDRAVGWARNNGLKVIVDLHGAPGSQNGFDNSGQRTNNPQWLNGDNIARTNAIVKQIAQRYEDDVNTVSAIAALNEPTGFRGQNWVDAIRQFGYDAYGSIRFPNGNSQPSDFAVILSDGFEPLSTWSNFLPPPQYQSVLLDKHVYQVFSEAELSKSQDGFISEACSLAGQLTSSPLDVVVGEWTLASTDCAYWLNARGRGARYEGRYDGSRYIGSCNGKTGGNGASTFSQDYKNFLRRFYEAQTTTFEKGAGWIFWTWKAEQADDWSYQAGLNGGWIPRYPTNRAYPGVCG